MLIPGIELLEKQLATAGTLNSLCVAVTVTGRHLFLPYLTVPTDTCNVSVFILS